MRGACVRGFTLLEIMVVVAIIGLFVGITVLSTDIVNFERRLEQEADRLDTIISFAADEAVLQSRDFGIFVCEDSYHFFVYDYDLAEWLPYGVVPFETRRVAEDMLIRLSLEDREVVLEPEDEFFLPDMTVELDEDDLDELPDPQIIILASGEITPFRMEFLRESDTLAPGMVLSVAFNGDSEVVPGER
jgi:general secretion pathway protein H